MKKTLLFLLLLPSLLMNAQCDPALRPVIFVHGFLASGDTWSNATHFLSQAGYCRGRLFVFDWNSISGNGKTNEQALTQLIDRILITTGAQQVDLIGHSAGGGLVRGLLKDSAQAQKVGRYVHIGSRKWTTPYAWFTNEKCMNIFSSGDRVAGMGAGPIEGAVNVALSEEDHYQVATSSRALTAISDFLNKDHKKPASKKIEEKQVDISGRAVLLGDNAPIKDASITIYAIDKTTGVRRKNISAVRLQSTESGHWGPAKLTRGVPYEIELAPSDTSKKKISYYFSSFLHDDPLVYLRGFPEGSRMSALLGKIPQEQDRSVLVVYSATAAMVGGRDSVTVNGSSICSPTLTPASKTVITSFVFDDGDGISSGQALKQYGSTPFIGGIDQILPAAKGQVHRIYYNGQILHVPGVPSSDRILLAVLK